MARYVVLHGEGWPRLEGLIRLRGHLFSSDCVSEVGINSDAMICNGLDMV